MENLKRRSIAFIRPWKRTVSLNYTHWMKFYEPSNAIALKLLPLEEGTRKKEGKLPLKR